MRQTQSYPVTPIDSVQENDKNSQPTVELQVIVRRKLAPVIVELSKLNYDKVIVDSRLKIALA